MATPTIEAISTQDITIDTDYALEIGITGDPEEVTVDGLFEGFHYSWDADTDTLTIVGEATRLLGDAMWVVSAKETSSSTAVTSEITYNVVTAAPIIEGVGEQNITQGDAVDIFIGIQNRATQARVEGLLTGLKSEASTEGEGDDREEGVRISGELPRSDMVNFTVESFVMGVTASNDGGEDIAQINVNINETPKDIFAHHNNKLYALRPDGTMRWETTLLPGGHWEHLLTSDAIYSWTLPAIGDTAFIKTNLFGVQVWENTIESVDVTVFSPFQFVNNAIFTIDRWSSGAQGKERLFKLNPENGETIWTYDPPTVTGIFDRHVSIGPEGNPYIQTGTNTAFHKVDADTGTLLWTLTYITNEHPLFDDNYIYLLNGQTALRRYNLDGTQNWAYTIPVESGNPYGFKISTDGNIYMLAQNGTLFKISTAGVAVWNYSSSFTQGRFHAVNSDGAYISNNGYTDSKKISLGGTLLWELDHGVNRIGDFHFDDEGDIYYDTHNTNVLRKINHITGSEIWSYTVPTFSSFDIQISEDAVYTTNFVDGANNSIITKLNKETGAVIWTNDDIPSPSVDLFSSIFVG